MPHRALDLDQWRRSAVGYYCLRELSHGRHQACGVATVGGNGRHVLAGHASGHARGAPVPAFESAACLTAASPFAPCRRCAETCPTGAITVSGDGPSLLGAACVGCGRCAATCPTEAIAVPGFGLPALPPPDGCLIECARVARADRMPGAHIVPCLGGLSSASLLEFVAATGTSVTLIDRGWCAACPAGQTEHPWAEALSDVAAVAIATHRIGPSVGRAPLPLRRALPLPDHLDARGAARRSMFRRRPEATPGTKPTHVARVRRVEPRQSLRRAAAIARLAARPVSAALSPGLTVSDRCAASRVCVAACPTSALSVGTDAQGTGLDLDPTRCTACGACATACPEQAITVRERGAGQASGPVALTRTPQAVCPQCGTRFAPQSGETLCPVCVREHEVARLGFALMRRPAIPDDAITECRSDTGFETTPAQGGG